MGVQLKMAQHKHEAQVIPLILDYIEMGLIAINNDGIVIICNSEAKRLMDFEGKVIGESSRQNTVKLFPLGEKSLESTVVQL